MNGSITVDQDAITMYQIQFSTMFSYLDKHLEEDTKTAMYSLLEAVAVQLAAQDSLSEQLKGYKEMIETLKETNAHSLELLHYAEEEIKSLKDILESKGYTHERIVDFEKI